MLKRRTLTRWSCCDEACDSQATNWFCAGHTQHLSDISLASSTFWNNILIHNSITLFSWTTTIIFSGLFFISMTWDAGLYGTSKDIIELSVMVGIRAPSQVLLSLWTVSVVLSLRSTTYSFDAYFWSIYPIPGSAIILTALWPHLVNKTGNSILLAVECMN